MKQCGQTFQKIKEFSFILQTNFIPLIKKNFNLQNNEFLYSKSKLNAFLVYKNIYSLEKRQINNPCNCEFETRI